MLSSHAAHYKDWEALYERILEKHKGWPWIQAYERIVDRCTNPNSASYQSYGARGIKCSVTPVDLQRAYFRDKAYSLRRKISIDRIDNNRGYEIGNIQWLTFRQNSIKGGKERSSCILRRAEIQYFIKRVYKSGRLGKLTGPFSTRQEAINERDRIMAILPSVVSARVIEYRPKPYKHKRKSVLIRREELSKV